MRSPRRLGRFVMAPACAVAAVAVWIRTESVERFTVNLAVTYGAVWLLLVLARPARRRHLLFGFVVSSGLLGVGAVLAELTSLTGLVDYRLVFATPTLSPAHDPRNVTDEELIFRRRPHDRLQGSSPGNIAAQFDVPGATAYAFDVPYDANGFRNAVDYSAADVVVLGDSFVEGPYVSDADIMTTRLASELGITVANLGMSTYGPQQQLVTLQRYGLPLKPRAVVHVFFEGNDLTDVHTYRRFRREGPEARHSFYQRSFARNALVALHGVAGRPHPSALPRSGIFRMSEGQSVPVYFLYPAGPLGALQLESLDVVSQTMADIHRLSSAAGAPYLVAFAPTKFRVLAGHITVPEGSEVGAWRLNDLPERLARIARAAGPDVAYVDLTPHLAVAAARGEMPFFVDDSHWNALGHRIAADAIAAVLATLFAPS